MIDRFTRLIATIVADDRLRAANDAGGEHAELFAGLEDDPSEMAAAPATARDVQRAESAEAPPSPARYGLADESIEAAVGLKAMVAHMAYRRSQAGLNGGRRPAKGTAVDADL